MADATALARTAPLTCAVLDVNLGCELVFPAAHVLRERGINTIFCTGYDVHVLQQDWPDAEVLSKPVSPQRLISAIRTACWMIPKLGGRKLELPHEADFREIKRDLAAKAAFGVGIF